MQFLKRLWTRIENAFNTAESNPSPPGANPNIDPRDDVPTGSDRAHLEGEHKVPHGPHQP